MQSVIDWLSYAQEWIVKEGEIVAARYGLRLITPEELSQIPHGKCLSSNQLRDLWPQGGLLCKWVDRHGKSFVGDTKYCSDDLKVLPPLVEEPSFDTRDVVCGVGLHVVSVFCALSSALHLYLLPQQQNNLALVFLILPSKGNSLVKSTHSHFFKLRCRSVVPLACVALDLPRLQLNAYIDCSRDEMFFESNSKWAHLIVPHCVMKQSTGSYCACSLNNIALVYLWPRTQHLGLNRFPTREELKFQRQVLRHLEPLYPDVKAPVYDVVFQVKASLQRDEIPLWILQGKEGHRIYIVRCIIDASTKCTAHLSSLLKAWPSEHSTLILLILREMSICENRSVQAKVMQAIPSLLLNFPTVRKTFAWGDYAHYLKVFSNRLDFPVLVQTMATLMLIPSVGNAFCAQFLINHVHLGWSNFPQRIFAKARMCTKFPRLLHAAVENLEYSEIPLDTLSLIEEALQSIVGWQCRIVETYLGFRYLPLKWLQLFIQSPMWSKKEAWLAEARKCPSNWIALFGLLDEKERERESKDLTNVERCILLHRMVVQAKSVDQLPPDLWTWFGCPDVWEETNVLRILTSCWQRKKWFGPWFRNLYATHGPSHDPSVSATLGLSGNTWLKILAGSARPKRKRQDSTTVPPLPYFIFSKEEIPALVEACKATNEMEDITKVLLSFKNENSRSSFAKCLIQGFQSA